MDNKIEYLQFQKDAKQRVKELAWLRGKPLAIIAMVALPIAIFLIVMGHLDADKEGLIIGYSALFIAVWNIAVYVITYFTIKKLLFADFAKYAQDGKIEYSFERTGDAFKLTRRVDGYVFAFEKSDIKKLAKQKTLLALFLKDKRILTLPAREDILQLLTAPLNEEDYEKSN